MSKETVYTTLESASLGLGLPLEFVKRLKRTNTPGFMTGGRIRHSVVSDYLKKHSKLLKDYEKAQQEGKAPEGYDPLKAKQLEKLAFELDVKRELYILAEDAKKVWSQAMEAVQEIMGLFIEPQNYNKAIEALKSKLEGLDL